MTDDKREYVFTVYGTPVPQGRPRFARMGKFTRVYDPQESRSWKNDVKLQVLDKLGANDRGHVMDNLHTGPVVLDLYFYLPRPKSLPKKIRHHVRKPDRDNLEKGVKDALKGVLWKDDSQVCDGRTMKTYGDPPRVVIVARMISHQDDLEEER